METAFWIIGGLVALVGTLVGFMWRDMKAEMKLVRDRTHSLANTIQNHEMRISRVEKHLELPEL